MVHTNSAPGAIAIVGLHAETSDELDHTISRVTSTAPGPTGSVRVAELAGVDHGVIARINETNAQLMPHGGPFIVTRLVEALAEFGVAHIDDDGAADPNALFPEAADAYEAIMLHTLARAASPFAIDVLLAQPDRWRRGAPLASTDRARRLSRLLTPPLVVVAGPPNVGKSLLLNTLAGRSISIHADLPGTTRDYTSTLIDLGGLVVRWCDTPGLRETTDRIEHEAISVARPLLASADLLIAMTDSTSDWPSLPRSADLRVASRADLGVREDADVITSSVTETGLTDLVAVARDHLVTSADLSADERWLFDERLGAITR